MSEIDIVEIPDSIPEEELQHPAMEELIESLQKALRERCGDDKEDNNDDD
jgi:hypothetical protein